MPTIQLLAYELSNRFEKRTREDKSEYYTVKDGQETPELLNLCRKAHGDLLPDDWRYAFIVEALDAIAESDVPEEADSTLEADTYTSELTEWLHSNANRLMYCNAWFVDTYAVPKDFSTFDLLQYGQLAEKQEVFYSVLSSLRSLADEDDNE